LDKDGGLTWSVKRESVNMRGCELRVSDSRREGSGPSEAGSELANEQSGLSLSSLSRSSEGAGGL
jgi:hypothetical protein